jgi:hypothetical protein
LQLRGHALPHPDAHVAYWCAVCTAARSENREPNAGIGRITAFSFSQTRADELAKIVRQSKGRSIGRIAVGIAPCASNGFRARPRAAAWAPRDRGSAAAPAARQSVARQREHAARKFFPRARRVQRIPSPCAGREGIGLSSPSLIARRYQRTLAVEFAAHYIY